MRLRFIQTCGSLTQRRKPLKTVIGIYPSLITGLKPGVNERV